jgi:tetratricopeptide (TPR) repeat protein
MTDGDINGGYGNPSEEKEIENENETNEHLSQQYDDENDVDGEEYDYIFGFGSIMNRGTHGEMVLPGVSVVLSKEFGYKRRWNFRSSTGFTALGVSKISPSSSDEDAMDVNGVLFRATQSMIPVFDRREVGYEKVRIPLENLEFVVSDETETEIKTNINVIDENENDSSSWYKELGPNDRLWLYVPLTSHKKMADENHPLLQSYVDTVLQGCLEWGGEAMAEKFIQTTGGWSTYFLNDTPSSRRPWLYRKDYSTIDRLLQKYASKTFFGDRKHPEEFSSAFHRRMKGTWSIPRRNTNFTGREKELQHLWARFSNCGLHNNNVHGSQTSLQSRSMSPMNTKQNQQQQQQQMVVKVEVAGMGGVGKTQLVTEFCYRHFPRDYGLVVWLNAESADSLLADYRQLLMDLAQENASEVIATANTGATATSSSSAAANRSTSPSETGKSSTNVLTQNTDEIVREVKTRLFRSQVPWLLVFDNLEDRSLLEIFVPRGAGRRGHILVTTRLFEMEWDLNQSCGSLLLGCFNPDESVELLRRAAGASNTKGEANRDAAKTIATKLGHLPLALGMAAAYMLRCDVACIDYLDRYNTSEKSGQSLLRHGKLQDYSLSVASSLSLSLVAIEKESKVAHNMLRLLCFLGPEQITKPLLRHLMNAQNQLELISDRLCNQKQSRQKLAWLGASALLSCGLTGFSMRASTRKTGMTAIKSLSAATAVLVTSYSGLALYKDCFSAESKHVGTITRPTHSAFSSTVYEDADSVWNILKSFSMLIVKEGKGSMHRLLAQALRHSQTEEDYRKHSRICLHAMQSMWTFRADESNTWKDAIQVLDHVKSVVSHVGSCGFDFKEDRLRAGRLSIEAGVYSAMALNAFIDAQQSFELAIALFENSKDCHQQALKTVRAEALHELGRVFRYQGKYDESEESLTEALKIYETFNNSRDPATMTKIADTLHELGVLEVKKHNLDSATRFLELSLEMRQRMDNPEASAAHSAATLHQLAAIMVAMKPPHLAKAKYLLQEALGLSRQIGQRAATMKQLARVTIRQGLLDKAETYLEQALDLYMELYGENHKNHINIAAVKFQQGALARQREQWEQAGLHFSACLVIRRNVYAYAKPVGREDEENPTHLEVSCVLHEVARIAFAQSYFSQAVATLKAEKVILERLVETDDHHLEKIYQSRMTNLTWLRKCAKETSDEELVAQFGNERSALKQQQHLQQQQQASCGGGSNHNDEDGQPLPNNTEAYASSLSLMRASMGCRLATRKLVLEQDRDGSKLASLNFALSHLSKELSSAPTDCSIKVSAREFRDSVAKWKDKSNGIRQAPLLEACDVLR